MNQNLCQTQECSADNHQAQLLHKEKYELRCGMCINKEDRSLYYNITKVSQQCKIQLKDIQQQIGQNKSEYSQAITKLFDLVIENIRIIQKKIIQTIQGFTLPSDVLSFSDDVMDQQNNLPLLHQIIQNYFKADINNDNSININDSFKTQIGMPQQLQKKIINLNNQLSQFLNDIQNIEPQYQTQTSIYQSVNPYQTSVGPISKYQPPQPPRPTQRFTIIEIMNQDKIETQSNTNWEFTLKSKRDFQLKGFQFGKGSENDKFNILIREAGQKKYSQDGVIIGTENWNFQATFRDKILIQENQEYTITISKQIKIILSIQKQVITNSYVQVLTESIPIKALVIVESN